jgi:Protein of unknown function (DUF1648)
MRPWFSIATGLIWLALPYTALDYWMVWDQLPARMAIHFDINWRANGWASREAALGLMAGLVVLLLITFTVTVLAVRRAPGAGFLHWAMLAFFYATIIFVCAVNHWVVRYNLGERSDSTSCIQNVQQKDSPKVEALTTES